MKNRNKKHERTIPLYIKRLILWGTGIVVIGIASIVTIQEYTLFKAVNQVQRQTELSKQKDFIRDLDKLEFEYIDNYRKEFEDHIDMAMKENVYHAYRITDSLYHRFSKLIPEKRLKEIIIQAISGIHSLQPSAYVFINGMDGEGVYYPDHPELSGENLLNFFDSAGNRVVEREIELIKKKEEGYLCYQYPVAKTSHSFLSGKITYVKEFEPFHWYFGSKCYLNDYYVLFKNHIAQKFASERFRYNGHLFLYECNGTPIVMHGKLYHGSVNYKSTKDSLIRKAFNQQINLVNHLEDGGLVYFKIKNEEGKLENRIAYVKKYRDCGWIVGATTSLDDMNGDLMVRKATLRNGIIKNSSLIVLVLIIAWVFELIIFSGFNHKYQRDIQRFSRFFRAGKGNRYIPIPVEKLHFNDFQAMGTIANEMIADRKRVFQELTREQRNAKRADELKTAFLANMSHEIRTPMNAIIGFSELLNDDSLTDDLRKEFIGLIQENGEALLNLISDIIDISKIESDQLVINCKPFNLYQYIAKLSEAYSCQITKRDGVSVGWKVNNKLPKDFICYSDEWRLKQVLDNLISNAVKFTPRGMIRMDVYTDKTFVYFSVKDSGIGISEEDLNCIFDRFVQGNNKKPLRTKIRGTGLGLAISKNIVELLGGEIGVRSRPGKGAEFFFHIQCRLTGKKNPEA